MNPFKDIKLGVFEFTLNPKETLQVPSYNKGNMLRGGFGYAFRNLVCIPQCLNGSRNLQVAYPCPISTSCPYKIIFEPSPPPNSNHLSKNHDIPRPFVFRPPETLKNRFDSGEEFRFGLILIGRALDYLPYFVLSFRELAEGGLGYSPSDSRRNRGRAKCTLQQVEELNGSRNLQVAKKVYSNEDRLIHPTDGITAGDWIQSRLHSLSIDSKDSKDSIGPIDPHDLKSSSITIRFLTPTYIRESGKVMRDPRFGSLIKRLRDRLNALSTFFGDGPLDMDFKGMGERAEKIRMVSSGIEWVDRSRTSSRTHQHHELSGFIGEAAYEGELNEFLPWLLLGELVHVGKHTAWGCGRFTIEDTAPSECNKIKNDM